MERLTRKVGITYAVEMPNEIMEETTARKLLMDNFKNCCEKLGKLEDLEEQIGMPLEEYFNKLGKPKEFMVTVNGKRFIDATLVGGEFREDGIFVYCVLVHEVQAIPFYEYFAKIYTYEEAEKKLEEMRNE